MVGQYSEKETKLIDNSFYEVRQKNCRTILDSNHLDGILFVSLENIRYLCGFTGSDGAFILTQKGSFFLTDSRYWTQAEEEVKGAQVIHYKKKMEGITSLLLDITLKNIGFESTSLTFSSHQFLVEKLTNEAKFIPLEDEYGLARSIEIAQCGI